MPEERRSSNLKLLFKLQVLGGQFWFGKGVTRSGTPLLYISVPRKSGISILEDNLLGFENALHKALQHFNLGEQSVLSYDEGEPEVKTRKEVIEEAGKCPSLSDQSWINKVEGDIYFLGESDEAEEWKKRLVMHEFIPQVNRATGEPTTVCEVCSYDTAKRGTYKAEEYERVEKRPREKRRKK